MSSPSKLVRVFTTPNISKAEVLKIALEEAGIPCMLENQHQAGLTGILPVKLYVNQENKAHAEALLAEFEQTRAKQQDG